MLTVGNILLSSDFYACAGFELYRNPFIVDRDFLNQPANQLLVVFGDFLCLLREELLHLTDAFAPFPLLPDRKISDKMERKGELNNGN